jgi:hypothetical protein
MAEAALHLRLRRRELHPEREALPAGRALEQFPASFHAGGRYRRAIRSSSVALVAVLVLAACARRDEVAEPILRAAKAVEDRDAQAVARWLTAGYHDAEHQDAQAVIAHVRQIVFAYERLNIDISRLVIEDLGTSRRARFRAQLSGTPKNVAGLEGLLPRSSAWDFESSLVYEGGRWRIATASWKPAE